ncbi:MAG: protein kinase [Myxococcales bacterium]|nr:protein kinase [Myxococcales bacterium]
MDEREGTVLDGGRFRLDARVAEGGFGVVYRATDLQRSQRVAIKVLTLAGESEAQRFVREGSLLARVDHPGVVRGVAVGTTDARAPWLAMEWLEGRDLRALLDQRSAISARESIELVRSVAGALDAVHAAGIVHRDIKPGNIFLRDGDLARPVLVDFGIAACSDEPAITRPGVMIGTPSYMAPEQIMARGDLDQRADLFSLGCVWFETLAGRAPFVAEQVVAVLAKVMLSDAPSLASLGVSVSSALESVLARLLARDSASRLPSARALLSALESIDGRPSMLPPSVTGTRGALTRAELRVRSVLVASSMKSATSGTLPTLELRALNQDFARISAEAERLGVKIYRFADRSWSAVTDEEGRDARDAADALCRVALFAHGLFPALPIAVATGRARFVGENPPIGEVIDRAAVLLGASAQRARIAIDEATAALVESSLAVDRAESHALLRGVEGKVERTLLGKPTPFVGREHEFYTGMAQVSRALDERSASVALFVGEAGAGKSRLLSELKRAVIRRWPAARVVVARCNSTAQGAALSLASSIVRAMLETSSDERAIDAIDAFVRAHFAEDARAREAHRDFLAALAGVAIDDGARSPAFLAAAGDARLMSEQLARSFDAMFDACARQSGIALVIEDAHWADTASVRLIEGALSLLRDRPIVLVAAARPAVRERFTALFGGEHRVEVTLGELSRGASLALARSVLDATKITDAELDALVQRAAGNAFFLEELVRSFDEHRAIAALPDSIAAMVDARFERMDDQARRVLRAASVFGQTFWRSALRALVGAPNDERLEAPLSVLVATETIGRRASSQFDGEVEYVFRHAILGDVAYASLTDEDRALGHKLAARWLEAKRGVDPAVLAGHFERGGDLARAAPHYLLAARRALAGDDLRGCLDHCDALDRCAGEHERARGARDARALRGELALVRAEAYRWIPDHVSFERSARLAMDCFEPGSDRWCESASLHCISLGVLERSAELAETVPALVHEARTSTADKRLLLFARLAIHLSASGERSLARLPMAELERALGAGTPADSNILGHCAAARAAWAYFEGDPQAYATHVARSIEAFDAAANRRGALAQRSNLGFALMDLGDLDAAERSLRDTIERARGLSNKQVEGFCLHNLGLVLAWRGAIDEGERVEREAIEIFERSGFLRFIGASKLYLADIALSDGRAEQAVAIAREAVSVLEPVPSLRTQARSTLARALAECARATEALSIAREAVSECDEHMSADASAVWTWRNLAECFSRAGASDEAEAARRAAKKALSARAAKIVEPSARRRFVESVPDHRVVDDW